MRMIFEPATQAREKAFSLACAAGSVGSAMPIRRAEEDNLPGLTWPLVIGFMFVEFLCLAVVAGLIFLATRAAQPNFNDVADAIRRELDGQVAAWNQKDMNRYLDTYWNDDKLVFYSGGDVTTGLGETKR